MAVFRRAATALVLVIALVAMGAPAGTAQVPRFRILVFTKTAKFRHSSIPAAIAAVKNLGAEHDFEVVATEDGRTFTDNSLASFDAVMFLMTTGDVLNNKQQNAFRRYITSGGNYVGVHAAADTEYEWPFYGNMLGTWFQSHPKRQTATIRVADRDHPSTAHLPARWTRFDEWYNFRANPRGKVHVLMTLDETTFTGGEMGRDHPIAWCRDFRSGRVWYTGLGHTEESYAEPAFLEHLLGGIETAAGARGANCTGTVWKHFSRTPLSLGSSEPMEVAVAPDGRALFIERGGALKIHDPQSNQTVVAATFDVRTKGEDGLLGIALDPMFSLTSWIYLYYSPTGSPARQRLSRFTLSGTAVAAGSEQVLLEIPVQKGCCHSAGSLAFDGSGNLYLATGDDTNPFRSDGFAPIDERAGRQVYDAQRSAGNTDDLRGKILRIRPEPTGTYSIPDGNLFPSGGGRPEIYVMGLRNPFRIAADAATGALYFADIGPDARAAKKSRGPRGLDEWNRTEVAGNFGWPYCLGRNVPYRDYDFAARTSGRRFDCAALRNTSPNNTGATDLPPAQRSLFTYPYTRVKQYSLGSGPRAAMAGPVYPAAGVFPGYYAQTFFAFDWARGWIKEVRFDDAGKLLAVNPFLRKGAFHHPIDVELGPDGTLYVLDYGLKFGSGPDAGLYRVDYSGPPPPGPPSVLVK